MAEKHRCGFDEAVVDFVVGYAVYFYCVWVSADVVPEWAAVLSDGVFWVLGLEGCDAGVEDFLRILLKGIFGFFYL